MYAEGVPTDKFATVVPFDTTIIDVDPEPNLILLLVAPLFIVQTPLVVPPPSPVPPFDPELAIATIVPCAAFHQLLKFVPVIDALSVPRWTVAATVGI